MSIAAVLASIFNLFLISLVVAVVLQLILKKAELSDRAKSLHQSPETRSQNPVPDAIVRLRVSER